MKYILLHVDIRSQLLLVSLAVTLGTASANERQR